MVNLDFFINEYVMSASVCFVIYVDMVKSALRAIILQYITSGKTR